MNQMRIRKLLGGDNEATDEVLDPQSMTVGEILRKIALELDHLAVIAQDGNQTDIVGRLKRARETIDRHLRYVRLK